MAKEPWQEDIYENQEETRSERRKRTQGRDVVANRVLTILASIFFVIVVV
ncbi:MAG: LysM domain-containing protein, partial [Streptococcus mitis]|nr:LysM domain-containing protein [Streptococcus mitis]